MSTSNKTGKPEMQLFFLDDGKNKCMHFYKIYGKLTDRYESYCAYKLDRYQKGIGSVQIYDLHKYPRVIAEMLSSINTATDVWLLDWEMENNLSVDEIEQIFLEKGELHSAIVAIKNDNIIVQKNHYLAIAVAESIKKEDGAILFISSTNNKIAEYYQTTNISNFPVKVDNSDFDDSICKKITDCITEKFNFDTFTVLDYPFDEFLRNIHDVPANSNHFNISDKRTWTYLDPIAKLLGFKSHNFMRRHQDFYPKAEDKCFFIEETYKAFTEKKCSLGVVACVAWGVCLRYDNYDKYINWNKELVEEFKKKRADEYSSLGKDKDGFPVQSDHIEHNKSLHSFVRNEPLNLPSAQSKKVFEKVLASLELMFRKIFICRDTAVILLKKIIVGPKKDVLVFRIEMSHNLITKFLKKEKEVFQEISVQIVECWEDVSAMKKERIGGPETNDTSQSIINCNLLLNYSPDRNSEEGFDLFTTEYFGATGRINLAKKSIDEKDHIDLIFNY